ncbi:hypothetical protein DLAC_07974 [Tieghemostelium lacteum]|uniref:Uncharacterized protein n=1 Tax=Tieghemostelium lacteum TaxID=361077 RepID=A0A151ZAW1_TIELA|nr:hypothetical protein DLAC_07974 [Tieghemostelium lacteum]|eukprot:KYQ91071.1 hypothetical protein DLAC_07974 [Tieghemostelium lacteum]
MHCKLTDMINIGLLLLLFYISNVQCGIPILNFAPYKTSDCSGSMVGIGFGMQEYQCIMNATSSVVAYQIENTNYANLTNRGSQWCDSYTGSSDFYFNKCGNSFVEPTNYYFLYKGYQAKIPPSSFVTYYMDYKCKNQLGYWFATNATVVHEDENVSTEYMCLDNQPFTNTCNSLTGNCQLLPASQSCNPTYTFNIECTSS